MYYVYIVRCSDDTYYVGQTHDVEARVAYHNEGRGAVYTAVRRPVTLVYSEQHPTLKSATKRERQIKRWSGQKRHALVTGNLNTLRELAKSHD
jgi:predicted GIY-YIG superfamily endonuclease